MKVNPNLIWDYSFSSQEMEAESFKRWYVARVLMRGGKEDIRAVGLETIRRLLPDISIPQRIREFWNWYFQKS
ncbi:MAG: hypothetical protein HY538_04860 [Deltaproteobacteria bacterium]|nr:hypothetical protein [Deltaproteobacteria bacterium]